MSPIVSWGVTLARWDIVFFSLGLLLFGHFVRFVPADLFLPTAFADSLFSNKISDAFGSALVPNEAIRLVCTKNISTLGEISQIPCWDYLDLDISL